jgi:hypothetical protein
MSNPKICRSWPTRLWTSESSEQNQLGGFSKFTPPTVANGKVYVAAAPLARGSSYAAANSGGAVVVYGYLSNPPMTWCLRDLGPQQGPWGGLWDPGPLLAVIALVTFVSVIVTLATVFAVGRFRGG